MEVPADLGAGAGGERPPSAEKGHGLRPQSQAHQKAACRGGTVVQPSSATHSSRHGTRPGPLSEPQFSHLRNGDDNNPLYSLTAEIERGDLGALSHGASSPVLPFLCNNMQVEKRASRPLPVWPPPGLGARCSPADTRQRVSRGGRTPAHPVRSQSRTGSALAFPSRTKMHFNNVQSPGKMVAEENHLKKKKLKIQIKMSIPLK